MRLWNCLALVLVGVLACDETGQRGSEAESESEGESEVESVCPGAPTLEDCFRGIAFADCGGDGEPVIGCGVEGNAFGGCLWFTGGCVADDFETGTCVPGEACDDTDDNYLTSCPNLLGQRGEEPWDAERAMTLPLTVDVDFSASSTDISCTGCSADNCPGQNVCVSGSDEGGDVAYGSLPDTLAIVLSPDGYKGGWVGEIEANLDASLARLCRIPVSDESFYCGDLYSEPPCATSGSVTISRVPLSFGDLEGLSGAVNAIFDDGLELSGEFLVESF